MCINQLLVQRSSPETLKREAVFYPSKNLPSVECWNDVCPDCG